MDINAVIGDIYDLGSSQGDWLSIGRRLFKCLGADAGTMRFRQANGQSVNVFELSRAGETRYVDHYAHIDPIRAAISRIKPTSDWASAVAVSEDLVDDEQYRQSEFYRDFARPNGQDHMLVGAVGDREGTVVGFFRQGMAFGSEERAKLVRVLPHIQRSLQLRQRLQDAELNARVGYAAFEALPGSALVVDADLNVLFANAAAARSLSGRGLPIGIAAPSHNVHGTRLLVDNRERSNRLRALVRDAASGGSGGAMRIELDTGDLDRMGQLAVLVSPQPKHLGGRKTFPGELTPVLILITELSRPSAPKPSLLSELFGLSAAEGAVALALLGGQTAESVARERDVSLETVRSQIRTVLRKSDATNLRDFERIGALLTALAR
ncbi:hypothetical protein SAMN05428969_3007 [Devosia sp. YR412]|uniref:helix-turn-helix transcriptional regulator n=1 Tax=Devosia sp. YR412 TaxID=1881030 RepID=UPI0008ABD03E|nr:hypothetical protein [Devosia sp. YR412]SEQ41818.1 hypothetical protein SAMN05428969_3007 [Devosia sp. YR412]